MVLAGSCGKPSDQPTLEPAHPSADGAGAVGDAGDASTHPTLGIVLVSDLTVPDARPAELTVAADSAIREAMYQPGLFGPASADEPTACKADMALVYGVTVNGAPVKEAAAGTALLAIEGRVHCPRGKAVETFRIEAEEKAPFGGEHGSDAKQRLHELLAKAAKRVAHALFGQVIMRHADDQRVLEVLANRGDDRVGVLMEAAAEAGERKLEAAVPALVRLSAHPDQFVAMRAGGALGLIGKRTGEVVRALAEMTKGGDYEKHLVAVNALGDIGGPEAVRYLDSLAVGHPMAGLREIAREAVRRARGGEEGVDAAP